MTPEMKEPIRVTAPSGLRAEAGLNPMLTEGAPHPDSLASQPLLKPAFHGPRVWPVLAKEGDWSLGPPQTPRPKRQGLRLVTEQWWEG